jgi:hypothetical protein
VSVITGLRIQIKLGRQIPAAQSHPEQELDAQRTAALTALLPSDTTTRQGRKWAIARNRWRYICGER